MTGYAQLPFCISCPTAQNTDTFASFSVPVTEFGTGTVQETCVYLLSPTVVSQESCSQQPPPTLAASQLSSSGWACYTVLDWHIHTYWGSAHTDTHIRNIYQRVLTHWRFFNCCKDCFIQNGWVCGTKRRIVLVGGIRDSCCLPFKNVA